MDAINFIDLQVVATDCSFKSQALLKEWEVDATRAARFQSDAGFSTARSQ